MIVQFDTLLLAIIATLEPKITKSRETKLSSRAFLCILLLFSKHYANYTEEYQGTGDKVVDPKKDKGNTQKTNRQQKQSPNHVPTSAP